MNYDQFGQVHVSSAELCDILYRQPDIDLQQFYVDDWDQYNTAVRVCFADLPLVKEYHTLPTDYSVDVFHRTLQQNWHTPDEYKKMDIAQWVLDKCKTQEELQRVGHELLLFQERNLFPLLCHLKYMVDTWRENNILWGVGRGSSVASYVLYLIGVHRINSMYYDLNIEEFLK